MLTITDGNTPKEPAELELQVGKSTEQIRKDTGQREARRVVLDLVLALGVCEPLRLRLVHR